MVRSALRKRDLVVSYGTALLAAGVALAIFLSLPQREDNPVFGFLTVATLVVTWSFGWRQGVLTFVVGGLAMLWYSLPGHTVSALLRQVVAVRVISNSVINAVVLFSVSRMRQLEHRNLLTLKRERLLAQRRAKALEKLRHQVELTEKSNEHLALALQAGRAGAFEAAVLATEPDLKGVIHWSPAIAALHGYDAEPKTISYHQWLAHCVHPADTVNADNAVRQSLQTGELSGEWRIRRRDSGEVRWISSRGKLYYDHQGKPLRMLGIDTDITERKLAQEALIRSEKLASVGRMAATVAHEINNPLETIVNSVYIASLDQNLSQQSKKSLQLAERELERVAHLTRQTLGFYRENTAPSKVDLSLVTQGVIDLFAPKLRSKGVGLEVEKGTACFVHAVAGELRQVISNLVVNAIDASQPETVIAVRTRMISLNGMKVVRLTVADRGSGIAPENLNRIFDAFFTTKKALGTGLGLWVSNGIVNKHHGRIRIRTALNRGTVFSVYLPAIEQARSAAASSVVCSSIAV